MKALGKGSVASLVQAGLTVAWGLLWVGLVLLVLAALCYGVISALVAAGSLDQSVLGDNQARWPVVVPALLVGGVVIGGALIIVDRLRRLFDSFTSGEPFRRENATHLRVIWITMLVIEVARYTLLALIGALFATIGAPEGAHANYNINIDVSTWMSIAVLIVLAEVFREGARMKEEQELTI